MAAFAATASCDAQAQQLGPVITQTPSAAPVAVLVLNQERVLSDSEAGKRILAENQSASARHEAEGAALEVELEEEERELTELRDTLPLEDFQARAVAFDEKVVRIRREFAERSATLTREAEARQRAFFAEVIPIITQIMSERGASLVFEQRGVLISGPNVDITLEVIRRIDNSAGFQ